MVALLLTTTISCSDAFGIVSRVLKVVGLSKQQKIELINTIKDSIPSCPITIEPDDRSKSHL
jgi:hypothetical protein